MISASLEKLFYMSGVHTLNRSQPPCREKASWALSFHPCQPPPAPLLNEGHFKHCFSLHSSQLFLLQGHDLFRACLSSPPPHPLSTLSRWEGPMASLGQLPPPFIKHPSFLSGMEFSPALPCSVCVSWSQPICRVKELIKSFFCPCKPIPAICNHLQEKWHCSLSICMSYSWLP